MRAQKEIQIVFMYVSFPLLFGSCATVKEVETVSNVSQAVITGGVSLIPSVPREKMKIALSGRVFLSTSCHFDHSQNVVELSRPGSNQKFARISIDKENEFSAFVSLPFEGPISVKLMKISNSNILDEKTVIASPGNDRISVSLRSCSGQTDTIQK